MRALLLAAGLGTRLLPLTNTINKCLVEINGRPLIDYWIELLSNAGINEILINLHHLPEQVNDYISCCKYPVKIKSVMEHKLLLTGGTLLKNRYYFQDEPLILIHADNLSIFNVNEFIKKFETRENNIEITMMTFITDSPHTCGIVELDTNERVIALHEKVKSPPSNLANAAVYILSSNVVKYLASLEKEEIDFTTEVLPHFLGKINTYENKNYHRDIGNLNSLKIAQHEYLVALEKYKKINEINQSKN